MGQCDDNMNENETIEQTEEKINNINQRDPFLSDLEKKEIEIEELNYRIETFENTIADISHTDPLLSDTKIDEIKTTNKERLEFIVDDNKPPKRRRFIHYRNRPDKWVKDMLEGKK